MDDRGLNSDDGIPGSDLPGIDDPASGGFKRIHFDYNSYALSTEALATLNDNAALVKGVPGIAVQIEGHCDERGTQEYNLALGEKRALVIREYLVNMGVEADQLITISFGEERPAVSESNEAAWSRNRRSEFRKAPES